MADYRKIGEVAPARLEFHYWQSPSDFEGVPLLLVSYDVRDGQYGDYAVLRCAAPDLSEGYHIATGAAAVMEQLSHLNHRPDPPILFQFEKKGRRWIMGDTEE